MSPDYRFAATLLRVIDGDTIRASVDLGFRITRDIGLRLEGIDAPEMSTDAGKAARAALVDLLPVGTPLVVQTYRDPGAWDRYTATVWAGEVNVNGWLVDNGHAVVKAWR